MSGQHAPLPPSGAPQWGFCSGSVAASLQAPNFETDDSREGTAAHWCGSECLEAWKSAEPGAPMCTDWIGKTAPNGVVIDEKMADGAQEWVSDVLMVCQQHGGLRSLLIEHRVHMPQIHDQNWGTLDTALWAEEANTLYLWDYKNGHRENSAYANLQLVDYVAGLLMEIPLRGDITIVMRIVQPFCYQATGAISEWVIKLADLDTYFNILHHQALEAMTNPTFTAGKHCRDCPAIGRCATAKRAGYSVITYAKEPYEINTLSGHELAVERTILSEGLAIIKGRLEAIDDELYDKVSKGDTGSGLTIESKFGNVAWSVPPAQAIALAGQFGVDAAKPGVLTPTQTKNKVPAKMRPAFEKVLKTVSKRPSNGVHLIQAADSRTARAFKRNN